MTPKRSAPRHFPPATARRLSSLLARELACIGAIETAMKAERRPLHESFLRAAKDGHQTAAGQLEALLRMGRRAPRQKPAMIGRAMKAQLALTQRTKKSWTLSAMRATEEALKAGYEKERTGSTGIVARALRTLIAHASLRTYVLSRHLEAPMDPCMRCLLDRPSSFSPLRRDDPAIFVCAACHEETLASFPADLREALIAAPAHVREDHVIERALGRPSKEHARRTVYETLVVRTAAERSALAIPPATNKVVTPPVHTATPKEDSPHRELALEQATPAEAAYTEVLFDPARLARSW